MPAIKSWREPAAKQSANGTILMSCVLCLMSQKVPAFHCGHRAIHSNSVAVCCFAGRAKNGYLWAAFLARRSGRIQPPHFHSYPLCGYLINIPPACKISLTCTIPIIDALPSLITIMKNWSGLVEWHPETFSKPSTEEEIQQIVLRALNDGKKIRVIGTGHSFTPVCATNHTLISLDNYQGLISVDKERYQATVKAGTKLDLLGELLFEQGMAMENLGDIDKQSIAGTISTGTHGTGIEFGTISTQVTALTFINGKGERVSCSTTENPSLFKAAQVAIGTLGIITSITLQCVPAYKIALLNDKALLSDVLNNLEEHNQQNRNFEFYWMPYTDMTLTKTTNFADGQPDKLGIANYLNDVFLENVGFKVLCEIANTFPSKNKWVSNTTAKVAGKSRKIYHSHKVYATTRLVRFHEMEYNVPADAYQDVMKDLQASFDKHQFPIHFPLENRFVKADDIYMSPAQGRDSAYIACHVYHKKDPYHYFQTLETIFKAYGGRPHWGKMHTLKRADIEARYPHFNDFKTHRIMHDPDGVFLSPYMATLFA